ncbi:MAG: cupredoxin domain-containing protein [candidate division KSB1 bacterium]|nr:cupredoxin domain-containing protein [candidate division KSB1 bacterium]MDZ7275871.1 cupredoxin domain-containing protein [candidate division KSB1 bacterium]MDZ7287621.1 cupredoxin domain-containing protein [candidate division KSB1 bacterium]MDZ7309451.1 cupredoxin domain-containing protein [candidate division KSB1 bacterium]MDZ7350599.1 cupredoxin domain-containing protein [candidate division KSB1 bacterium]
MRAPKRLAAVLLLAALALLLVQCGQQNPFEPTRGANEVWIQATRFDPPELTVATGTTVEWTNKDNTIHDITSGTPTHPAGDFSPSPPLKTNETYMVAFRKAGRFPYYCTVHPQQTGVIIVQ